MQDAPAHDKRVAICIDDFGLNAGVNEAAVALAAMGRISAISCMVGGPAWRAGTSHMAQLRGAQVDIGLHLDLTECPLAPSSRRALPLLMGLTAVHALDRTALEREIRAQLDAFEQGAGRPPDHVDGHQHIHQFPVVRDVLIEALLERYPDHRPWLRRTHRPRSARSAGFKSWVIERFGCTELSALARRHGFAQNADLLGVYDFHGDAPRYLGLLTQWIGAAKEGDLLMCHAAAVPNPGDPLSQARLNEFGVLSGPAFGQLLAQAGVRVAPLRNGPHQTA